MKRQRGAARGNSTMVVWAIVLGVIAVGLLIRQFVLRPNPNAVGVNDMPPQVKATGTEQRDPNAGPIPTDLSRRRGPVTPTRGQ